jgi:apolipoprotein N-acyltransferase
LGDWALELGGTSGTLGTSEQRTIFNDEQMGLKLAPIICWENEFSGYATEYSRAGANLLAVITNDGWWGNTKGHIQHMRFSCLRAIEQQKYLVRSANTGISTIIDAKGRPHEQLQWEEEGIIVDAVPLLEGQSWYVRTGNFLGPLMTVIFLLCSFIVLISRFFRIRP